jgi:hypothetical protein
MNSDWLGLSQIKDMLDAARAGRRRGLNDYLAASSLRCASPDCSSLVVVRLHHAYFVDGEGWADLNSPPEPNGHSRQVIVYFQLWQDGIGQCKQPVPFARRIVGVAWSDGCWVFRLADGELRATPLELGRAMSDSSFAGFFKSEEAIARNLGKIDGSVPIEHLGPRVDWAAIRDRLPPTIEDDVLGTLTRGSEGMDFATAIVALGRRVSISVAVDTQGSWETALRRAAAVVAGLDAYVAGAKEHAVSELLKLKNETWLEEDEVPVSVQAFQALMQLEALTFYDDRSVLLSFADGESDERSGLFWGHAIVVSMDSEDLFTRATIEG